MRLEHTIETQMGSSAGMETYYKNATTYAKSLGETLTVGNAGTTVPTSFIGTVDNIVIYEGVSTPTLALFSNYTGYATVGFSFSSATLTDYVFD